VGVRGEGGDDGAHSTTHQVGGRQVFPGQVVEVVHWAEEPLLKGRGVP
jgi:hypothetical protein